MKKYLYTMIAVGVLTFSSVNAMAAEEEPIVEQNQEVQINEEVQAAVEVIEEETAVEIEEEEAVAQGQQVVDFALEYIGTPYVSGGNSLSSGVDCSGFVQQVYKHFDVSLERSSRSQYASNGVSVKKEDLKPGDLVFYGYSSVNHVAIYIGDGKIVHAPVPGKTVCTAPLWQRGDANIIGYKRIIE